MEQPLILQDALPVHPWAHQSTARLPGVNPLDWGDWLLCDSAYAAQMDLKDSLLSEIPDAVLALRAEEAGAELLALMLDHLPQQGFARRGDVVTRPDGKNVGLSSVPLVAAARLVQQDICIMERRGDEHVLTAAVLCFPSNWKLSDKIGRPMSAIHTPVPAYTEDLARRVQRIFDAMRPDRPLWRMNYLLYADHHLHQPQRIKPVTRQTGRYVRCERQSLVKLPQSGAIVFGIHNIVVPIRRIPPGERETLYRHAFQAQADAVSDPASKGDDT